MTLNIRNSAHLVDLLTKVNSELQTDEGKYRIAIISTLDFSIPAVYITFEGEQDDNGVGLESTSNTPYVLSYTPTLGDRVLLTMVHGVWTIVGSVGAVGGAGLITDWNDAIIPGAYVGSNLAVNSPTANYCSGTVSSPDGTTLIQEAFEYARGMNGASYKRMFLSGDWTPWLMTKGQPTQLIAGTPFGNATSAWVEQSLSAVARQGAIGKDAANPAGFALPVDSWYEFYIAILWPGNATGRRIVGIGFSGNGSGGAPAGQYDNRPGTANSESYTVRIGPLFLAAGNYSLFTYQDSGSSLTPLSIVSNCQPASPM